MSKESTMHIVATYSMHLLLDLDMFTFNTSLDEAYMNCYNHKVLVHIDKQYEKIMEPQYRVVHTPRFNEVVTEPLFLPVILLGVASIVIMIGFECIARRKKFGKMFLIHDEKEKDVACQ